MMIVTYEFVISLMPTTVDYSCSIMKGNDTAHLRKAADDIREEQGEKQS